MEDNQENYHNYIYRPNSFEPLVMICHHSFEYDYYQEYRRISKYGTMNATHKETC